MEEKFQYFEEYQPVERFVLPESSPFIEFDDRKIFIPESKNTDDFTQIYSEISNKKVISEKNLIESENYDYITDFPISSLFDKETLVKNNVSKIEINLSSINKQIVQKDIISGILNKQPVGFTQTFPTKNFGQIPSSNTGALLRPWGNNFNDDLLFPDKTKPEELPEMALPILDFIDEVQPHIVIGCDRGGRLFSLAMHAAWRETRAGQPFPTLDGKLHFARISKSEDPDVLQEKIDQIVEASLRFGEQRGNVVEEDEQLRVLFVDDWIIGGGTKHLTERLMKKYNAQTYFAVLCGGGADVAGSDELKTRVSWHDRPEEIGVNYLSYVENNPDGSFTQKQEVVAVRGLEAVANRRKIQEAARQLDPIRVLTEVA